MSYTVSEVARMSGVTVRTLHHYDEIGLVRPSHRTEAGYRIYERDDLERLQEVLLLRELELSLEQIGELLDGETDRLDLLEAQRSELLKRRDRLDRIIATVERSLTTPKGPDMSDKELFGGFDPTEHEEEADERWGDTDAYKESSARTARYTVEDWKRQAEEIDAIEQGFADLLTAGESVSSALAADLAERARLHIDTWFYPCSKEMHAMLAEGYVTDPRFKKHYDERQEGLAQFVRDAIVSRSEE